MHEESNPHFAIPVIDQYFLEREVMKEVQNFQTLEHFKGFFGEGGQWGEFRIIKP